MKIEYTISEKDFINAAKLASQVTKKQMSWLFLVGLFLFLLAIFGGHKLRYISVFGIIGGVVGYFLIAYVICPFQSKRTYKKYKSIQEPLNISFQNDGYKIWNSKGESNVKWSDLLLWRQNKEYLLLYFAPKLYHLLPKRLSNSGLDVDKLIACLESQIGSAT